MEMQQEYKQKDKKEDKKEQRRSRKLTQDVLNKAPSVNTYFEEFPEIYSYLIESSNLKRISGYNFNLAIQQIENLIIAAKEEATEDLLLKYVGQILNQPHELDCAEPLIEALKQKKCFDKVKFLNKLIETLNEIAQGPHGKFLEICLDKLSQHKMLDAGYKTIRRNTEPTLVKPIRLMFQYCILLKLFENQHLPEPLSEIKKMLEKAYIEGAREIANEYQTAIILKSDRQFMQTLPSLITEPCQHKLEGLLHKRELHMQKNPEENLGATFKINVPNSPPIFWTDIGEFLIYIDKTFMGGYIDHFVEKTIQLIQKADTQTAKLEQHIYYDADLRENLIDLLWEGKNIINICHQHFKIYLKQHSKLTQELDLELNSLFKSLDYDSSNAEFRKKFLTSVEESHANIQQEKELIEAQLESSNCQNQELKKFLSQYQHISGDGYRQKKLRRLCNKTINSDRKKKIFHDQLEDILLLINNDLSFLESIKGLLSIDKNNNHQIREQLISYTEKVTADYVRKIFTDTRVVKFINNLADFLETVPPSLRGKVLTCILDNDFDRLDNIVSTNDEHSDQILPMANIKAQYHDLMSFLPGYIKLIAKVISFIPNTFLGNLVTDKLANNSLLNPKELPRIFSAFCKLSDRGLVSFLKEFLLTADDLKKAPKLKRKIDNLLSHGENQLIRNLNSVIVNSILSPYISFANEMNDNRKDTPLYKKLKQPMKEYKVKLSIIHQVLKKFIDESDFKANFHQYQNQSADFKEFMGFFISDQSIYLQFNSVFVSYLLFFSYAPLLKDMEVTPIAPTIRAIIQIPAQTAAALMKGNIEIPSSVKENNLLENLKREMQRAGASFVVDDKFVIQNLEEYCYLEDIIPQWRGVTKNQKKSKIKGVKYVEGAVAFSLGVGRVKDIYNPDNQISSINATKEISATSRTVFTNIITTLSKDLSENHNLLTKLSWILIFAIMLNDTKTISSIFKNKNLDKHIDQLLQIKNDKNQTLLAFAISVAKVSAIKKILKNCIERNLFQVIEDSLVFVDANNIEVSKIFYLDKKLKTEKLLAERLFLAIDADDEKNVTEILTVGGNEVLSVKNRKNDYWPLAYAAIRHKENVLTPILNFCALFKRNDMVEDASFYLDVYDKDMASKFAQLANNLGLFDEHKRRKEINTSSDQTEFSDQSKSPKEQRKTRGRAWGKFFKGTSEKKNDESSSKKEDSAEQSGKKFSKSDFTFFNPRIHFIRAVKDPDYLHNNSQKIPLLFLGDENKIISITYLREQLRAMLKDIEKYQEKENVFNFFVVIEELLKFETFSELIYPKLLPSIIDFKRKYSEDPEYGDLCKDIQKKLIAPFPSPFIEEISKDEGDSIQDEEDKITMSNVGLLKLRSASK